jgi:hypothetical protein
VLRPHIATAWLPAASWSSVAMEIMLVFWSGPTSLPRILQPGEGAGELGGVGDGAREAWPR